MELLTGVVTAGAFVQYQGGWVFAVGPTAGGDRLGVVRLGGHRERGEAPWECAEREVLEEAAVHIRHLQPPATYWFKKVAGSQPAPPRSRETWHHDAVPPLVAVTEGDRSDQPVTLLYLAQTDESPIPSAETRGLLFLTVAEIDRLVNMTTTLTEFLEAGGRAALREGFPAGLPLEPFYHVRLLHRIFAMHPELTSP